uniref:Protein SET DOMAIN GROUP 41 n=1 Tax=Noccaea caerulescens TaxID=107243 RepID=A0A1J3DVG1_NOCCA
MVIWFLHFVFAGKTVGYGPKVITRSIKKIKSGEEITISYIDLLQPTGLRQSDLWSKYRFMCNCGRCAASPLAYVDSILEGVLALEPQKPTAGHHHGATNKDDAVRKMTDRIEEAIDDFLSDDINPETCCEKIESVLHHGIQIKADSSQPNHHHLWLHPSHHVALNAYITLATAYRIRSTDSETDTRKAFDMSRISAAYSLFLACVSHHLVSAEPSLAISAANFWKSAGESLLDLARKFLMEEHDVKCSKCLMLVGTYNSRRDIKENLKQILRCVTDISQAAWSFLTRGCSYLQKFKSPVEYSFTVTNCEREESSEDQRGRNVLLLSFHCLLYADLLTYLCYGRKSYMLSQSHSVISD